MRIDPSRYRLSTQVLCLTILWLGLRSSEPGKIRKEDIDFTRRAIVLRDTKSGGDQEVPLPNELVEPLQRLTASLQPEDYAFINQHGTGIRRRQVEKQIRQWGNEHGVSDLTPQIIRRSLAQILENRGATQIQVESMLRHTGSTTNRRHYAKINLDAARDALEFHPIRPSPNQRQS